MKKISIMQNSKYCTFYIVRHGETEWNVKGLLQGQSDSPLTKKGIRQSNKLAKILKDIKFDAAFSSDSLRAKKSADIILLEKKITLETTELLRERSFGKWEGRGYEVYGNELRELLSEFEKLSDEMKMKFKFPDIESDEEILVRFIRILREIALGFLGKTVLVVTHGAMMRTLLIHLGFGTYASLPPGAIENSGFIKLRSDGVDFFIDETRGVELKA